MQDHVFYTVPDAAHEERWNRFEKEMITVGKPPDSSTAHAAMLLRVIHSSLLYLSFASKVPSHSGTPDSTIPGRGVRSLSLTNHVVTHGR